jgi:hypothetical protein
VARFRPPEDVPLNLLREKEGEAVNLARAWYPDGTFGIILFVVAAVVVISIITYYGMKNNRRGSSGRGE